MICSNPTLRNLATKHTVILKSNTPATEELKTYCIDSGIILIQGKEKKGFGANNNEIFAYALKQLQIKSDDYFLVLNPDVIIGAPEINELLKLANKYNTDISAINLYKNIKKMEYDNSIRHYHSLLNPFKSLFRLPRNDIYDKSRIKEPLAIDWAAGSFLLFSVKCYLQLGGFDERYFMYFEDTDICTRANNVGLKVMYFPQIEAIHLAAYNNRKVLSKHFKWYLRSLLRYHIR